MRYFHQILFALLFIHSAMLHAEIYKWTDESGQVHYGEKPPQSSENNTKSIEISGTNKAPTTKQVISDSNKTFEKQKHTIKLPDGTRVLAPKTEEEVEKFKKLLNEQLDAKRFLAKPKALSREEIIAPTNASTPRNLACPVQKDGDCSNRKLKNADYSRLNFTKMTFAKANLENANFSGSKFNSGTVTFTGANLRGADFSGTSLNNVDFTGADLTNADFTNINCSGCKFDNANLTGANFSGERISHVTFKNANLKDIHFSSPMVHWIAHDYTGAKNFDVEGSGLAALAHIEDNPQGILVSAMYTINGCNLGVIDADCSNKDLSGHRILPVEIENVDFTGANLKGTDLSSVHLKSAVFDKANLDEAKLPKFERYSTGNVTFKGASLKGALFTGNTVIGDFTNADLSNTDLSGKDARSANFKGAIFSNTKFDPSKISIANLEKAKIDDCENCKEIIKSGTINVEQLKRYLVEEQDTMKLVQLRKDDPEAYKTFRKLSVEAQQDLSLLSKGQGIIKRKELVDLLVTMLSTDNPRHYKMAYRIIDMKDEQNYRSLKSEKSFIEPLCADPNITKVVKPLLKYTAPAVEVKKSISRRSVSDTKIRELSAKCLLSSNFEQHPDVHQLLIDLYKVEEDNQLKRILLTALTESRRDETLPLLINAIKKGDNRTSNYASRILGDWKAPPAELIPWLTEKFRGNRNVEDGWRDLLVQYGGMAKDVISQLEGYYQELKDAYRKQHNKTLHDHDWHTLIFQLKRYSEVNSVTYGLKNYDRQTVLESYLNNENKYLNDYKFKKAETISHLEPATDIKSKGNRITRWAKQLKDYISKYIYSNDEIKADITNPFYSENKEFIQLLAKQYGLNEAYFQHIKAISCAEYKTHGRYGSRDNGQLGIDVFRASSDKLAIQIGQKIVDQKQPQRLIAQTGKLVYIIWGDPWNIPVFDLLYSDIRNYGRKHKSTEVANK